MSNLNLTECNLCYNSFSSTNNTPKILECGHTVCETCISKLKEKKCPFCKAEFDLKRVKTNFQLITEKRKSEEWTINLSTYNTIYNCSNHSHKDRKSMNYCETCMEFICVDCCIEHTNRRHIVKFINTEKIEKIREYQRKLMRVESEFTDEIERNLSWMMKDVFGEEEVIGKGSIKEIVNSHIESLKNSINEQISLLNQLKSDVISIESFMNSSLDDYKSEFCLLIKENLPSIVMCSYFKSNEALSEKVKLAYNSIYNHKEMIKALEKPDFSSIDDEIQVLSKGKERIKVIISQAFDSRKNDFIFHVKNILSLVFNKESLIKSVKGLILTVNKLENMIVDQRNMSKGVLFEDDDLRRGLCKAGNEIVMEISHKIVMS